MSDNALKFRLLLFLRPISWLRLKYLEKQAKKKLVGSTFMITHSILIIFFYIKIVIIYFLSCVIYLLINVMIHYRWEELICFQLLYFLS